MEKTIRNLVIIAASLVGVSLLLLLLTMPFQREFCRSMGYPDEIQAMLPIFPTVPFLRCILQATCISLLLFCCGKRTGGAWAEILILVFLAVVLPLASYVVSLLHGAAVHSMGTYRTIAQSAVNNLFSYCTYPAAWGQGLAYFACGMSIAYKKACKRQNAWQTPYYHY